jgi:Uma2 family endonuclease
MSTTARRLTYDDLLAMPEDGRRHEIVHGELIELPSPEVVHQRLLSALFLLVHSWVSRHQLGEVFFAPLDVRLSPHNIVQPDLIYLSAARFGRVEQRPIEGAPDLIVEILSPSNRDYDERVKADLYAKHHVAEYWTVDANQDVVRGRTLAGERYQPMPVEGGILLSIALPGLELDVPALFAEAR